MGIKERARAYHARSRRARSCPARPACCKSPKKRWRSADEIGYPVILKASAGGGGRGMRVVQRGRRTARPVRAGADRKRAPPSVRADVYLEKFIGAPRHIEFQMLADEHGNVEILGERECSIQRRHQKLLEESPSPAVSAGAARARSRRSCATAMARAGYTNAGTVEFLMDENGKLYFIEVNARIQVEHPVTEFVTGIDLVKSQIRIAAGEPLADILRAAGADCAATPSSAASTPRIRRRSRPRPAASPGLNLPGGIGVRVDTAAYHGLRDSAVLRFAGGQADHLRQRPHRGDPAHAARARACSSWKASTRRFRCTSASWPIRIFRRASSTRTSSSASCPPKNMGPKPRLDRDP